MKVIFHILTLLIILPVFIFFVTTESAYAVPSVNIDDIIDGQKPVNPNDLDPGSISTPTPDVNTNYSICFCATDPEADHTSIHLFDGTTGEQYGRGLYAKSKFGSSPPNVEPIPDPGVKPKTPSGFGQGSGSSSESSHGVGAENIDYLSTPGYIHDDQGIDDKKCICFQISKEQYNKAKDFINQPAPQYRAFSQNCVDFMEAVAEKLNLDIPSTSYWGVSHPQVFHAALNHQLSLDPDHSDPNVRTSDDGKKFVGYGKNIHNILNKLHDVIYKFDFEEVYDEVGSVDVETEQLVDYFEIEFDGKIDGYDGYYDTNELVITFDLNNPNSKMKVQLPRHLIDATQNGNDIPFRFMQHGDVLNAKEIQTNSIWRTFEITVPDSGQILVTGTELFSDGNLNNIKQRPVSEIYDIMFGHIVPANPLVPDWIKNTVNWWTQDIISDKEFVTAIGFMVKSGLIKVDNVSFDESNEIKISDHVQVPDWVRNNGVWWVQGVITDEDFKSGIQFMVKEKVIDFEAPKKQDTTNVPNTSYVESPDIFVDDSSVNKAVELGAKISLTNQFIHEWTLQARNYENELLKETTDAMWDDFSQTNDKELMNYVMYLENLAEENSVETKNALESSKSSKYYADDFFSESQRQGHDKFNLISKTTNELGDFAEPEKIKSDDDYEDTLDKIEKQKNEIRRTWHILGMLLELNFDFTNNQQFADLVCTSESLYTNRDEINLIPFTELCYVFNPDFGISHISERMDYFSDPVIESDDLEQDGSIPDFNGYSSWDEYCKAVFGQNTWYIESLNQCVPIETGTTTDDAEEFEDGEMYLDSSDLEPTEDGGDEQQIDDTDTVTTDDTSTTLTAPGIPTGLAVTGVTETTVTVTWIAPENNGGSQITGYMMEKSTVPITGMSVHLWNTNTPNIFTYTFTGLSPNTEYAFDVATVNAIGYSPPSTRVTATTTDDTTTTDDYTPSYDMSYRGSPEIIINPYTTYAFVSPGSSGTVINYEVTAYDDSGNVIPTSCSPVSGSFFAVGSTSVFCEASFPGGHLTSSFIVDVWDD